MGTRKELCKLYSVPQLNPHLEAPASVAGTAVIRHSRNSYEIRIIIRRDLSIRLSSVTLLYRFSVKSIRVRDEKHPFVKQVYAKSDINQKEYLCVRKMISDRSAAEGCTALVCSVVLENGETFYYRFEDYEYPETTKMDPALLAREPFLKTLLTRYIPPTDGTLPAARKKSSKKHKYRTPVYRRSLENAAGVLTLILIGIGVIGFGIYRALPVLHSQEAYTPEMQLTVMLAERHYSEAYQLTEKFDDERKMQEVCRDAAEYYLSLKDYEKAYLYAIAAPRSFESEIFDAFAEHFISQERYEEAYHFLKEQTGCDQALQRVCSASVTAALTDKDYDRALFYASGAPESLEMSVFDHAAERLVQQGKINKKALSTLLKMSDAEKFDTAILEALNNIPDPSTAFSLAARLKSETLRAERILDIAIRSMETSIKDNDLAAAGQMYRKAAKFLTSDVQKSCMEQMLTTCEALKNTAGKIYFKNLAGEDTSAIPVTPEETSIRDNLSSVYFLLSESQKRTYHAVSFDLYKEAYRIRNGVLQGTQITDAVSVSTFEYQTLVLHADGSVSAIANDGHNNVPELPPDKDIVQIAAGLNHAAYLHNDGTVSVYGSNASGQADTGSWQDIVKIAVGADFTAGLRADGTLIACGSNRNGQCNVNRYADVYDLAACDQSLVLLFKDGSLKVVGDISGGLKQADSFTNIRRIRAAGACVIAEKTNGTYQMAHSVLNANPGSVSGWRNADQFAAGSVCIGYVNKAGEIHIEGDGSPVVTP